MHGTERYAFWLGAQAYELLTQAEARRGRESMADLRAVEPFLARCVLHAAYRREPDRLRRHIRAQLGEVTQRGESLVTWVGDAPWLRCIDEVLLADWMGSHALFERHTPDFAVNVPMVTPVTVAEPYLALGWLRISLEDVDGNRVPDERYEVEFADGSVQSGQLDAEGAATLRDVPRGSAKVRWPGLHPDDWSLR